MFQLSASSPCIDNILTGCIDVESVRSHASYIAGVQSAYAQQSEMGNPISVKRLAHTGHNQVFFTRFYVTNA